LVKKNKILLKIKPFNKELQKSYIYCQGSIERESFLPAVLKSSKAE
jgi:hypothetical protein